MGILDSSVTTGPAAEEPYYYWHNRVSNWQLKFAWLPHRCDITGKMIWLQLAYRGRARWTGPGDDAVETRWHDRHEHLIYTLKGPYG